MNRRRRNKTPKIAKRKSTRRMMTKKRRTTKKRRVRHGGEHAVKTSNIPTYHTPYSYDDMKHNSSDYNAIL